ncbi:hypothetical protein [Pseudonocardia spinosispora]|uniref:hypothetical protein n=1 Tax=Pseudonocardia spinosispora TaxID=103441 RepID=UPI00040B6002|nr:hypothetical protein [Pseudonocardia spinosispora]
MRVRSDDDLYSLQNRYLGPPGRTIPFQARYVAYVTWAAYVVPFLIVRQQLGIAGSTGTMFVLVGTTIATVYTMRLVSTERPVSAVVRMVWLNITAPRPGGEAIHAAPNPTSVMVTAHYPTPSDRQMRRSVKRYER